MEISYRLHIVGQKPTRDVTLPELPGSSSYEPGLIDSFGETLSESWPTLGVGGLAGGLAGAKLVNKFSGKGFFRTGLGGMVGVALGVFGTGIALAQLRGSDNHRKPSVSGAGPVASTKVETREDLRVMTYNLHGGMGGPKEFLSSDAEIDALAEAIKQEKPDVLVLQEVDRFSTRSNYRNVLKSLADRLDADSAVGAPAMTNATGREQDVAIMTFNGNTITDARNIIHQDPRGNGLSVRLSAALRDAKAGIGSIFGKKWNAGRRIEVRNTVDAMVRTANGNSVRVLSGHYEWPGPGADHQARQVGSVAGALDAWSGPTIWGADFNVRNDSKPGERERQIMDEAGLRDSFEATDEEDRVPAKERSTHPGDAVGIRGGIDRIYVSSQFDVNQTWVSRDAGDASDHLPVVTDITLKPDR